MCVTVTPCTAVPVFQLQSLAANLLKRGRTPSDAAKLKTLKTLFGSFVVKVITEGPHARAARTLA